MTGEVDRQLGQTINLEFHCLPAGTKVTARTSGGGITQLKTATAISQAGGPY